ncbi:hypothetical protein [Brunnivagina elsteri]|uniref:ParB/Sulfiredoxin domain-containing protein n=1 Tax=Brunnivagina elsteri CCALA 953 TaxID=987040 RepID=A0A2A2TEX4_9CYAN|nr:hypothetical protein [Calothrix elsteri]PAX52241.1 hypothetical protein CK510_20350 [Calothrix elsteri CCALA 953]
MLQIDSEFKNLIPPLSSEEKLQLEANLKEFGCLDPLIVWQGENILLDGHNRYEICTREQIPYKIVEIEIGDREAAICWIANHQLGRRNITPEVASYLRGKRYLNLKGDRTGNLKQNSPNGNYFRSVDAAKSLAEQYKVTDRTIRNDALFTEALDTLEQSLGDEVKHSILARNSGLTKKDVLSLAKVADEEGQEVAQKLLSMKQNKSDIVQQIKDKKPVPNPHFVGEVCRITPKADPDLKPFSGCWCIVYQINLHSCGIKTWKVDFETVKPENLERTYGVEENAASRNCDRLRCLANKVHSDYEATYTAVLEVLGKVKNPSSLTQRQERLLTFLEGEY